MKFKIFCYMLQESGSLMVVLIIPMLMIVTTIICNVLLILVFQLRSDP